jgi:hypothetical protein
MASEFAERIYDETLRLYTLKDNGRQRVLLPQGVVDEERFAREVQAWSYQLNGGQVERVEEDSKVYYQFYVSTVSNFQYRWVTDIQPWSTWDQVFEHTSNHEFDDKVSLMVYVETEFGDLFVRHQALGLVGLPQPPQPTVGVYELWATLLTIPELARNDTIYEDKVKRTLNLRRIFDAKSSLDSASMSYVMRLLSNADAMNEWKTYEAEQKVYQDYLAKIQKRNDEIKRLNLVGQEEDKRKEAAIPQLRLKLKYWFFPPTRPRLLTSSDMDDHRRYVGVSLLPANSYFTTRPTNPTPATTNLVQYPEGLMYYMPLIMTDSGVTVETTEEDLPSVGGGLGGGSGGGGGDYKEVVALGRLQIEQERARMLNQQMEYQMKREQQDHMRRVQQDVRAHELERKKLEEIQRLKEKQEENDHAVLMKKLTLEETKQRELERIRQKEEDNDRAIREKQAELDQLKAQNATRLEEFKTAKANELERFKVQKANEMDIERRRLQDAKETARREYEQDRLRAREEADRAKQDAKDAAEKARKDFQEQREKNNHELALARTELDAEKQRVVLEKIQFDQKRLQNELDVKLADIKQRETVALEQAKARLEEAETKRAADEQRHEQAMQKMDDMAKKAEEDNTTRRYDIDKRLQEAQVREGARAQETNAREWAKRVETEKRAYETNVKEETRRFESNLKHQQVMAGLAYKNGVGGGGGGGAQGSSVGTSAPQYTSGEIQKGLDATKAYFAELDTKSGPAMDHILTYSGYFARGEYDRINMEDLRGNIELVNAAYQDLSLSEPQFERRILQEINPKTNAAQHGEATQLRERMVKRMADMSNRLINGRNVITKMEEYQKVKDVLKPKMAMNTEKLRTNRFDLDVYKEDMKQHVGDIGRLLKDPSSKGLMKTLWADRVNKVQGMINDLRNFAKDDEMDKSKGILDDYGGTEWTTYKKDVIDLYEAEKTKLEKDLAEIKELSDFYRQFDTMKIDRDIIDRDITALKAKKDSAINKRITDTIEKLRRWIGDNFPKNETLRNKLLGYVTQLDDQRKAANTAPAVATEEEEPSSESKKRRADSLPPKPPSTSSSSTKPKPTPIRIKLKKPETTSAASPAVTPATGTATNPMPMPIPVPPPVDDPVGDVLDQMDVVDMDSVLGGLTFNSQI